MGSIPTPATTNRVGFKASRLTRPLGAVFLHNITREEVLEMAEKSERANESAAENSRRGKPLPGGDKRSERQSSREGLRKEKGKK